MNVQQYLEDVRDMAASCPLANTPAVQKMLEDVEILQSKLTIPLRVAVIGEVKAGKSTLINTFAGGEVAPVNVTEATACIMTIAYGKEAAGKIFYTDGTVGRYSRQEVFDILQKHENDQAFFAKCHHVELTLPLRGLRQVELVDTPGLATITTQNEARTKEFFQQVDVVLWVFNAQYLGQYDVNESLRTVAKMGKPVIGVINRIDLVDADPEELVEYVQDELGLYLHDEMVFPISAQMAFEGMTKSRQDLLDQSGFGELYDYLQENIDRRAGQVHEDSIQQSAKAIELKIRSLHKLELENIKGKLNTFLNLDRSLDLKCDRLKDSTLNNFTSWCDDDFLKKQEMEMLAYIDSLGVITRDVRGKVNAKFSQVITNERINLEVRKYFAELDEEIRQNWQREMDDTDKEIRTMLHAGQQKVVDEERELVGSYALRVNEDIMSDYVTGAALTGGAVATYVAVLGPAAAHISMFSALGAVMPPVLIAGALAGVGAKFFQSKQVKEAMRSGVQRAIFDIRKVVYKDRYAVLNQYFDDMKEDTLKKAKEGFVQSNFQGRSVEELQKLVRDLQVFTAE